MWFDWMDRAGKSLGVMAVIAMLSFLGVATLAVALKACGVIKF
jgi:hypothetical protein